MINKTILLACFFMFLFFGSSFGQIYLNAVEISEEMNSDSLAFYIHRIETNGNFKTKDYIILRELFFDAGDVVKLDEIFLAQKRVLNLFLFNRVIFDLVGDEDALILIITVVERWYIFPLPIFYFNERSWNKISYGAKLLYYNFLGRNILLNLTAAFGYNPLLKFSYRNPWFGDNLKLMTNFSVYTGKVQSLNLDFEDEEDERTGFDWLFGRRFGNYFYLFAQIGYIELRHPELTLSENGVDKLPSVSVNVQYDNRDLKEYPHKGFNFLLWGKKVKSHHPIDYYRYGLDARGYFPLTSKTTLALRGACNLSHGLIPLYDRAFIGYIERIRGQFYKVYEGENAIIGSIEFRFPISKIRYLDLSEYALPSFEDYYRNLKFGISAGIFYDYGVTWFQSEKLEHQQFQSGFGLGLHFHVPYVDVLRLELGFNTDYKPQLIADIGVAF